MWFYVATLLVTPMHMCDFMLQLCLVIRKDCGCIFVVLKMNKWPVFIVEKIIITIECHWVFQKVRHPRIELGPPRWQRGIIATRLMALASTGNRTRATCLEGRYSNHWTIDARQRQDSNLRGQSPPDFKSGSLTTRTHWRVILFETEFLYDSWWLVTWLKFCSAFKKSFYTSATVTFLFQKIESEAEGQCTYNSP